MARTKTDGANASSKLTFQPDHSVGAGQSFGEFPSVRAPDLQ